MKKIFAVLCCAGLLAVVGCGSDDADPVAFSKNYVAKKLSCSNCDLSKLDYKVVDKDDELAIVEISGKIPYKEKVYLSMEDGKWTIAPMAPKHEVKCETEEPKEVKHEKAAVHEEKKEEEHSAKAEEEAEGHSAHHE